MPWRLMWKQRSTTHSRPWNLMDLKWCSSDEGGPFGRQRDRREGIITMELKERDEKAWTGLICLTKRNKGPALVNTSKNLWIPQNVGNFLTRWAAISFYKVTRIQAVRCERQLMSRISATRTANFPFHKLCCIIIIIIIITIIIYLITYLLHEGQFF